MDQIVACLSDKLSRSPVYADSEIISQFKITNSALQTLLQERISLNDQIEQKIKEYANKQQELTSRVKLQNSELHASIV